MRKSKSLDKIDGIIGTQRLKALIEVYKNMPEDEYPTDIDLTNNNFSHNDLDKLIDTFKPKILKLNLCKNKLGSIGGKKLAKFFESGGKLI